MATRRNFLLATAVGSAVTAGGFSVLDPARRAQAQTNSEVEVASQGAARAVVVVANDADSQTREAAQLLITYVHRSTGAQLPLLTESEQRRAGRLAASGMIYVGRNRIFDAHGLPALGGLDQEGYVIWPMLRGLSPDLTGLTVVGPTSQGTLHGVTELLERYVGVRWLLPGPDGEDVPQHEVLSFPLTEVRDQPACQLRILSPLHRGAAAVGNHQAEWYLRNRGHSSAYGATRMRFLHNLSALLPPAKYFAAHPDWYPNSKLPSGSSGWQPSMTAEGTVEAAVAEINAYFDSHPAATSYALGINDGGGRSGGWVESKTSHPSYPGRWNYAGFLHMSDVYFGWVNQVVEGVLATHPDKWFGCLAYHTTWQAPSFTIHPRVVPFICHDRSIWSYPEAGDLGRRMTDEWAAVATTLGWYEYGWSFAYSGPRVNFSQHAENAQFLYSRGVKYNQTELYPIWSDGPKAWLFARHLWDANLDMEAEVADWYERAVGSAGAPELAAYFERWEDLWSRRIFDSMWFQNWYYRRPEGYLTNYVPIDDHNYLTIVTDEDLAVSRQLLESVVTKASTVPQKKRAQLMLHRFEYHEAAALSFPRQGPAADPQTSAEAIALLDKASRMFAMAKRRDDLADEFATDSILPTPVIGQRGLKGVEIDNYAFGSLVDWLRQEGPTGPVRQRVDALAQDSAISTMMRGFARMLIAVVDGHEPHNGNGSFEDGDGAVATGWEYWIGGLGTGTMRRTTELAVTGSYSLLLDGVDRGAPARREPISATGTYGFVARYFIPAGSQTGGTFEPTLALGGPTGAEISRERAPKIAVRQTAGRWATACKIFRVDSSDIASVRIIALADGFKLGERLYFDDLALYRLDD